MYLTPTDIADVGRIALVGGPQGVGSGLITPLGRLELGRIKQAVANWREVL